MFAAAIAAIALSGCFRSEQALLGDSDSSAPIADGAIYEFQPFDETDERNAVVRFIRSGAGYELRSVGGEENLVMRVTFAEVVQTPERDYIAQVAMGSEDTGGYQYWFVWPGGENRYQIQTQSVALDDAGQPTFDRCAEGFSGCEFTSLDDLLKHYRDVAYPVFSRGRLPSTYVDMIPVDARE